jgi:two-component system alkaline phosphatase synthesis response regulator PhoP
MTPRPDKFRILVVDDEEDICEILQYNLQNAGYIADVASSSEEALYKMKNTYHLLLLDIMMDGISGLKLAQLLREDYSNNVPIIFISALDTENDIIQGFSKGGDDYIPKPFSVKEVLARVNAVLSRTYNNLPDEKPAPAVEKKVSADPNVFTHKELKIEFDKKRVFVGGEEIVLTKKENEILILLAQNPNKLFSREDILQLVWKEESYVLERTVDVHIARLRKKIGPCGEWIANRSGYGYCLHI